MKELGTSSLVGKVTRVSESTDLKVNTSSGRMTIGKKGVLFFPQHNIASPFKGLLLVVQDLGGGAILARVVREGPCRRGLLSRNLKEVRWLHANLEEECMVQRKAQVWRPGMGSCVCLERVQ